MKNVITFKIEQVQRKLRTRTVRCIYKNIKTNKSKPIRRTGLQGIPVKETAKLWIPWFNLWTNTI